MFQVMHFLDSFFFVVFDLGRVRRECDVAFVVVGFRSDVKPASVEAKASDAGHDDEKDTELFHFKFLYNGLSDSASLKQADEQYHDRDDQENVD